MSHAGKMRRGKLNRNPSDREYFLKNSKPKEEPKVEEPKKKVKKNDN